MLLVGVWGVPSRGVRGSSATPELLPTFLKKSRSNEVPDKTYGT